MNLGVGAPNIQTEADVMAPSWMFCQSLTFAPWHLNPGIKPVAPGAPALAGRFLTTEPPGKLLAASLELCIQMFISFLFSFAFRFSSFHSY